MDAFTTALGQGFHLEPVELPPAPEGAGGQRGDRGGTEERGTAGLAQLLRAAQAQPDACK